ncbi:putative secreted protein [Phaeomoniella chlamydospora]|uniref:Putative secreted protein n=1 Tax=Phaeomoniella chlamydospora TaxID=158046 RepID=A0A0G2E568_PHACM|nr:putative secreted protein [Phaeomoniella chlamydospora]
MDKHEFTIVDEKTGLIQIYHPVPWNLTSYGGSPEQQWIVDARFQELDIATGKVLFEWSSLDYIDPSEGYLPLNPGQAGSGFNSSDAWDYFHINSVDKDKDGNYLISARDANAILKIDGQSGDVIWQLGGKSSNFTLGEEVFFGFQHDARFQARSEDGTKEVISFYDNSAHGTENGGGKEVHLAKTSSGKIVEVDTKTWHAKIVKAFYPPDDLLSKSQGSTQVLPNGNVLVNWGSEGAVTEFLPDGRPIFHAYMDSDFLGVGVENYRGYRYNWTGTPNEDPAVVVLDDVTDGSTHVYVSWNGDTRTQTWRFYEVNSVTGQREYLGEAARSGFETEFTLEKKPVKGNSVQAAAVDAKGEVLVDSSAVQPELMVHRFHKDETQGQKGDTGLLAWLTYRGQKFFKSKNDL